MEIFKQNIAYECAPLRASSRALAEGTLSPPPGMPPMARILSIDGRAGGSGEAVEGKLMIDGAVTLSVLYLCEEGKSHGFESVALFKHAMDLSGAAAGMRVCVQCSVAELKHNLTPGGLEIRARILIDCSAYAHEELSAVSGAKAEGLEVLPVTVTIPSSEILSDELELRDEARLPRVADRLLCTNGFCRVQNLSMEGSGCTVSGMLRISVLFAAPDGTIVQAPFSMPFETRMDLPESAESAYGSVRLLGLECSLSGEDIVTVDARVELTIVAASTMECDLLADAYATGAQLSCQAKALHMRRDRTVNCRGAMRLEAPLPEGQPEADRVLAVRMRPALHTATAGEGTLTLMGDLHASLIYLSREGNLHSFTCDCDAPALASGMDVLPDCACELLHAGTSTGAIMLQCALDCAAMACSTSDISVVTDLTEEKRLGGIYGPVVYFPTEGEGLWQIGKRFGVPIHELRKLNPDLEKGIPPALLLNLRRPAVSK